MSDIYPYIEPTIKDRTADDVTNKTAKAFFNVLDWQRIYNNAYVTKLLVDFVLSLDITFNEVAEPTITTIPTVTELNTLLANINRIYENSTLELTLGLDTLKEDWEAGTLADSPDYLDANEWETLIESIFFSIAPILDYRIYCGVAGTGQPRLYQHRWRRFDWVPDSITPVRRPRTGVAITGTGLTRKNKFRRYD